MTVVSNTPGALMNQ